MKNARFVSLALLSLLIVSPVSVQANDSSQKTLIFAHRGKKWTNQADHMVRKAGVVYFKGNVKATSNQGDKILARNAELCQTPGKEKLTLSPVIIGTILKADKP